MKIAVTGASGHVGANLIRMLLRENHKVRVLAHSDSRAWQGLDVETVKGGLEDNTALQKLCYDCEVVFHLAAEISIDGKSYETVYKINVEGTKNILIAARRSGVKRFIHFSSIHALEQTPLDKPVDESRPLAIGANMFYEKTKALAEQWVMNQNRDDFQVIVLNPTAIIGPFDFKPSYMGQVILKIYKGKLPGLIPGGYDWVDVRDVARAAVTAMEKGEAGERYLLSGQWQSLATLAKIICVHRNRKCRLPVFPFWLVRSGLPFMAVYAKIKKQHPLYTRESLAILRSSNRNISHEKARKVLGFSTRPLEETVGDTLKWFKKYQYI